MVNALGVIPARKESTRFPNKILAPILDRPMIQYVWNAAKQSRLLDYCVVATDCENILKTVKAFGGEGILSPSHFVSGTERVAWVAEQIDAEIIVNIQGDEPLLRGESIDLLIEDLANYPEADLATLAVQTFDGAESRHVVKVLCDAAGFSTGFSRTPVSTRERFLKHIGIYAYRKKSLKQFCQLPVSLSEKEDRLEQLRAIENGMRIRVVLIDADTIAVDVPSDVGRVENYLRSYEN